LPEKNTTITIRTMERTVVRVPAAERLICSECGADLSMVQTRVPAVLQPRDDNAPNKTIQVDDDLLHKPNKEFTK
jgi:hypothetical protein